MLPRTSATHGHRTGEQLAMIDGVQICTEAFGDRRHPALLLIPGACASMIAWDDEFCWRLANAGRYVIRFDIRDQGPSSSYPPGEPSYDLNDLADDAVGVLNYHGVERAHLLGASSGGMIAQLTAIRHPSRVLTLMPMSSTPDVPDAAHASAGTTGATTSELPPPTAPVFELIRQLATVDWSDLSACIEAAVVEARTLSATTRFPLNETAHREYAHREYSRQRNILSFRFNTPIAETRTLPWRAHLAKITAPTLVIHGTEDPVLPYPHGVAISNEIPGAKLLTLDGVGHAVAPPGIWPVLIPAILQHTKAGS
jgi:pimeloyl-ACP methyl ester carboxylesterase